MLLVQHKPLLHAQNTRHCRSAAESSRFSRQENDRKSVCRWEACVARPAQTVAASTRGSAGIRHWGGLHFAGPVQVHMTGAQLQGNVELLILAKQSTTVRKTLGW
jgi:hypothetical protein